MTEPVPAVMFVMPVGSEPLAKDVDGNLVYGADGGLGTAEPIDVQVVLRLSREDSDG